MKEACLSPDVSEFKGTWKMWWPGQKIGKEHLNIKPWGKAWKTVYRDSLSWLRGELGVTYFSVRQRNCFRLFPLPNIFSPVFSSKLRLSFVVSFFFFSVNYTFFFRMAFFTSKDYKLNYLNVISVHKSTHLTALKWNILINEEFLLSSKLDSLLKWEKKSPPADLCSAFAKCRDTQKRSAALYWSKCCILNM